MAEHWCAGELPGLLWDDTRQQPNPPTAPDLWGQGLTAYEQHTITTIDLYEQWVKAGPPPLGTSTARWWDKRLVELHDAIQPPAPAATEATDTTKTVCDCPPTGAGLELCPACPGRTKEN